MNEELKETLNILSIITLLVCGVFLVAALIVITRGIVLIPVPFLALAWVWYNWDDFN